MLATVVAWVTILSAAGIVSGVALAWRAARSVELRQVTFQTRELAQDVIARGGLEAEEFLDEAKRRAEQELADLVGRLNDRKLRKLADELLAARRRTFGASPATRGPRIYFLGPGEFVSDPAYKAEDEEWARRAALQVEAARKAVEAAELVFDRINRLERFLWRRQ